MWARVRRRARVEVTGSPTAAAGGVVGEENARYGASSEASDILDVRRPLLAGTYVTDGSVLLRIEQIFVDARSGRRVLELENCATMELSVWTADELAARSLRCVDAMDSSQLADTIFESELGRPLGALVLDGSRPTGR